MNSQSIRFGKELALALALAWATLWLAGLPWLDHFGGISLATVATFLLISLNSWAHLNPQSYGVLAGSTLHEVAQVAAAVSPIPDAFQTGMLTKLTRVLFLAPVIAILPRFSARKSDLATDKAATHTPLVPWYVIGFLVTGAIVTAATALPASVHTAIAMASQSSIFPTNFLIAAAMGGIGLQINLELLRTHGLKLLVFAGDAWLVLFLFALALTYVW